MVCGESSCPPYKHLMPCAIINGLATNVESICLNGAHLDISLTVKVEIRTWLPMRAEPELALKFDL